MEFDPSLFSLLFGAVVLVGPILLAITIPRAVRGKDYDLFAELG